MNRSTLKAILAVNVGVILGVCLAVWLVKSAANHIASVGIGILGILILNVALLFQVQSKSKRIAAKPAITFWICSYVGLDSFCRFAPISFRNRIQAAALPSEFSGTPAHY